MCLAPGALPAGAPRLLRTHSNLKHEGGAAGAGTALTAGPLLLRGRALPGALRGEPARETCPAETLHVLCFTGQITEST